MNSQSHVKSPEALRAMVAGTLANFQHPTLKHNLTALKALRHVAWLDDTLHIELQMPFLRRHPVAGSPCSFLCYRATSPTKRPAKTGERV